MKARSRDGKSVTNALFRFILSHLKVNEKYENEREKLCGAEATQVRVSL